MSSVQRALLRAVVVGLAAIAFGPVGVAMAEPPALTLESPTNGSVSNNQTPSFSGTSNDLLDDVTLNIYAGASVEPAELVQTLMTLLPPLGGGAWSVGPAGSLADGVYTAQATQTNVLLETGVSEPPVTFTVEPPPCSAAPSIEEQPTSQPVTAPASATFKASASTPENCAAPTVQWYSEASGASSFSLIGGATSAAYMTPATSTAESGTQYEAIFTNLFGSTTTTAATLTVEPPPCSAAPSIEEQPTSQPVTAPDEASFTASASTPENCAAPTVQWYSEAPGALSFSLIGGAMSSSYTTPATSTAESGTRFEVIFTNAHGETTSNEVTLTVNPPACSAAPSITEQPVSQPVTAPAGATFKASASTPENCAAPTVQWYSEAPGSPSFSPISGAMSDSYTTPASSTAESGTEFEATFTNAAGSTKSSAATLTVNPPPPTVTAIEPSSGPTAGGTAVTIRGKGFLKGSTVTIGSAASGVRFISEEEITAKTHAGSGTQEVVVTDVGGTSTFGPSYTYIPPPAVTLNQPASPSNNTTPSFTGSASDTTQVTVKIYAGATVKGPVVSTAIATGTGSSWSSDNASAALKDGQYTATATQAGSPGNPSGVSMPVTFTVDTVAPTVTITTPGSGKTLSVSGPTFSGAAGDASGDRSFVRLKIYVGASVSGTPTQTLQVTATGTKWTTGSMGPRLPDGVYTAQVEQVDEAGNLGTASVTFTIKTDSPAVTLDTDGLAVRGSAFVTGATPSFTGSAGTAPEDSRTVTVKIYVGTSTAAEGLVRKVEVTLSGSVWTTGSLAALSEGTYTAQAEQTDSNPYQQTGVSKSVTFIVDSTPPLVSLAGPAEGTSTVGESQVVTGSAGTASGDLPAVTVQLFSGSVIAAGQTPVQSITVNAEAGAWSATFAGLSPGSYTTRAEQSDDAGNVGVSASSTFTIIGSSPALVPAPGPPAASFSVSPATPHAGEAVSLLSSSTDATSPITAFAWDPAGTGAFTPGGPVIGTSFLTPGRHLVQLRVTGANGLSSVASQAIEVTASTPELMRPFPIVQISATRGSGGVKLKLLSVQASAGARITVACKGPGCPIKTQSRVAAAGKVGVAPLQFRRFERSLQAGVILEIRVSKPGEIGKYTRFVVRRGRIPSRVDTCLAPAGIKPIACPSS